MALDPRRYRGAATPAVLVVSPLTRELLITCSQARATDTAEHHRMLTVLHDQLQAASSREPLWIPAPVDARLRRACALIADHLAAPLTLQQIGERIGVGQRTLSRLFRDELGMTFPQWRTQLRLHRALLLLAERHDVTTVATQCGWATPSAFIDTYRRALGHTPGRAMNQNPTPPGDRRRR